MLPKIALAVLCFVCAFFTLDLTRCTAGELEDISRYNGRFILQGQDGLFILKSLK